MAAENCAMMHEKTPKESPQLTAQVVGQRVLEDGTQAPQSYTLMVEHIVAVFLNGTLWDNLHCTATDIAALVLGRLYTEGMIVSADALPEVRVAADGRRADVVGELCAACKVDEHNTAAEDTLRAGAFAEGFFIPAQIFQLMRALSAEYPLYRATHGCHSATLFHGEEILCVCEDLSRHNALDKIIGRALLCGVPLSECIVYSSGRAPYDMIAKAVRAGVGGYISKAVPTQQGLALAKAAGLPIICMARNGGYTLF